MTPTEEYSKQNSPKETDSASATSTALSAKETEDVMTMGRLGFAVSDVASMLEIEEEVIFAQFRERKGEIYRAYTQGRIEGETQIRQTIMDAALNSSSPMLAKMLEYYSKSENENNIIWEE